MSARSRYKTVVISDFFRPALGSFCVHLLMLLLVTQAWRQQQGVIWISRSLLVDAIAGEEKAAGKESAKELSPPGVKSSPSVAGILPGLVEKSAASSSPVRLAALPPADSPPAETVSPRPWSSPPEGEVGSGNPSPPLPRTPETHASAAAFLPVSSALASPLPTPTPAITQILTKDATPDGAAGRDLVVDDTAVKEAALREAGSSGAALRAAELRDAAQLKDADLRGAESREAALREAALKEAQLKEAQLKEAQLKEAQLKEAQLKEAAQKEAARKDAANRNPELLAALSEPTAVRGWLDRPSDRAAEHASGKEAPVAVRVAARGVAVSPLGELMLEISGKDVTKGTPEIYVMYRSYPRNLHKKPMSIEESRVVSRLAPRMILTKGDTIEAVLATAADGIYDFRAVSRTADSFHGNFTMAFNAVNTPRKRKNIGAREIRKDVSLVKILMPEGIAWDDDSAFDGFIEDTVSRTKYNSATGLVWKEYK